MVSQDLDMIQYTLQCNQALKKGRPRPPQRTRREPVCDELKIQNPTWSGLQGDLRITWSNETNNNKEKIIDQFSANSKSAGPVTKNHQLRTVYKLEFENGDGDGYYSDCMVNSEGTYQFNVNSSVFDTTVDDDSNGESVLEGSELYVNAATAKKQRPSILKIRKKILKSSEMPTGAVPKMMASKQMPVMTPDGSKVPAYITMAGNMATIDYS